jgi:hypothetical protein
MMLQKHTLITAALLASLALSACGKKTDVMNPPAPESKKEGTLEGQDGKPGSDDESDDTNGSLGGALPPQEDEQELPPTNDPVAVPVKPKASPSPTPKKQTEKAPAIPGVVPAPAVPAAPKAPASPKAPKAPAAPQAQQPEPQKKYPQPPKVEQVGPIAPAVSDVLRAPEMGENEVPNDYASNDVNNITRDGITKRLTGGVTGDGYVYTSSSTDELLNFLRKRNERVGAESRRQNLAAAGSVVSAKISQEGYDNDSAVITLRVQESGGVKVYNLAGGLGEGRASKLRMVRDGNGERTTGAYNVSGSLKCVDLDGGCETTMARLEIGNGNGFGVAYVVFRNSKADLYFLLPAKENYSGNPEFYTLSDYFISTIKDIRTTAKIQKRTLSSWEVVNGRSGFTFTTKGYNDELLAFAGPLLSQDGSNTVNVRLNRIGKDQENSLDLLAVGNSRLNYANTIQDARLVANNGLGQIRLVVTMRKRNNYAQDRFAVTVMRVIKPIVDLEDDNLK